jgi:hypothetical protein
MEKLKEWKRFWQIEGILQEECHWKAIKLIISGSAH